MLKSCVFFILFITINSCQSQSEKVKMDSSKIKEIIITNKVDCSPHHLVGNKLVIKDQSTIDEIIKSFSYSEPIAKTVNLKSNNGFFEIDFYEKDINHYYTVNYTVYDGVVLLNNNNGDMLKNDRLEILIYKLFVNN